MQNIYKNLWKDYEEKNISYPTRVRNVKTISFKKFAKNIDNNNLDFGKKILKSLFSGDVYIIKKAFKKKFFEDIKVNCRKYFKNKPSSFYKMLEGCPNFHRIIDMDTGKKYSFKVCKHAYYFYKWNGDPINIFDETYQKWRRIKILMGLDEFKYENNTPIDGVIDRIQIVQYPSKFGFLEPHSDPYKFQKFFISGYMSKKGKDFKGGGFYAINKKNKVVDVEKYIDVGDIGIGFATIIHGVAPVDKKSDPNWDDINNGRWFYSLYSNQSDEVKKRHTGLSATKKIKIKDKSLFPELR